MNYEELYPKAKALVEKEREGYALEKLTNLIRQINQQKMVIENVKKVFAELIDDLNDLRTYEVGYSSAAWIKRPPYPPGTVFTNIE